MVSSPISAHRFIGRQEQIGLLDARWQDATRGLGSTVLVAGDAGCGKSRLVREFRKIVAANGSLCVVGECFEHAQGSYAPFADALRAFIAAQPDSLRDALAVRRILSSLLPELSETSAVHLSADKRQQFDAYIEALRRVLAASGGALAIEDIHWADKGTLDLLQHLVRATPDLPLLLVVTYRPGEGVQDHLLSPALAKIVRRPGVCELHLPPLSDEEMDEWLVEAARDHPHLPRQALQSTRRLAEGNPLFAEELLKHAIEGNADFPLTLREVVLERLRPLTQEDRLILVGAAVMGARFDPAIVSTIAKRSLDDVLRVLRHARDLQLVVGEAPASERFRFRHALFREILYREPLTPEVRAIHKRIGKALEADFGSNRQAVELAYHFWEARDMAGAAKYSELAGDAEQTKAPEEAAAFYERALELGDKSRESRARLYEKLASALDNARLPERASRAFAQAIEHWASIGDIEKVADLRAELARQLAFVGDVDGAIATCRQALETLESLPHGETRARVLMRLASIYGFKDDYPNSVIYLEQGLRNDVVEPRVRALLLAMRAVGLASTGNFVTIKDDITWALAAAADSADDPTEIFVLNHCGLAMAEAGDEGGAIDLYRRSGKLATENFLMASAAIALLNEAVAHIVIGDLPSALRSMSKAKALGHHFDVPTLRVGAECVGFLVASRAGTLESPNREPDEATIDAAIKLGPPYSLVFGGAFAEHFGLSGRPAKAQTIYARSLQTLEVATHAVWNLVYAARFAHSRDVALLRAAIQPWAAHQPTSRGRAYLDYLDACLLHQSNDLSASKHHALAAAQLFEEVNLPYPRALALELAGNLVEALKIYKVIGAGRDSGRLDVVLAPKGRRNRRAAELSSREREVAQLVADGKSNKVIADLLCISERTVENHLTSVYKKLEATSRTQLAALLLRPSQAPRSADSHPKDQSGTPRR